MSEHFSPELVLRDSWAGLYQAVDKSIDHLLQSDGESILSFYATHGGGKTYFLHDEKYRLQDRMICLGPWDFTQHTYSEVYSQVSESLRSIPESDPVMVLLDNADALLDDVDNSSFISFESELISELINRTNTLCLLTSQAQLSYQWHTFEVRLRHQSYPIPPLDENELKQTALAQNKNPDEIYKDSFGYPFFAALALKNLIPDDELENKILEIILKDLSEQAIELAWTASMFPLFDANLISQAQQMIKGKLSNLSYADYMDLIHELGVIGLVQWEMKMGAYHFINGALRQLLMRIFSTQHPEKARFISQFAETYFIEASRQASYLQYNFGSAIYHLSVKKTFLGETDIAEASIHWAKNRLENAQRGNWEALLENWTTSSNDPSVRLEIEKMIGKPAFDQITKIIEQKVKMMEEPK